MDRGRLAVALAALAFWTIGAPSAAEEPGKPAPGPAQAPAGASEPAASPPPEREAAPPAADVPSVDDPEPDEGFRPSERIPAGSRVSFPVDI